MTMHHDHHCHHQHPLSAVTNFPVKSLPVKSLLQQILQLTQNTQLTKVELLRSLEASLGYCFNTNPVCPSPTPLNIVISGPSGVGKDAVIKKLRESRESIHFVVTATSRPMRPGEVDGKDYYLVSKEQCLKMIERDELFEYALVYGDYKGIPKKQIKEYMGKGCDIVLRVDIQGAETLRRTLGNSAVFVFWWRKVSWHWWREGKLENAVKYG
ncbi:hypothetical protein Q3G72_008599 [Acer saccharum]|nr:hypothetical protein Q3G72_008599 [Acer saccharum]